LRVTLRAGQSQRWTNAILFLTIVRPDPRDRLFVSSLGIVSIVGGIR